jgi:hypothetical protein
MYAQIEITYPVIKASIIDAPLDNTIKKANAGQVLSKTNAAVIFLKLIFFILII